MEFTAVQGENTRLADILKAQVYVESLRELRLRLVHMIALLGCLSWIVATLSGALPGWLSRTAETIWPLLVGVFLLLLIQERRGKKEITRLIHEDRIEIERPDESPDSLVAKD